ncbi:hypothetical protein ACWD7F_31935 [Streptomyces sp. NPDC005122]
MPLMISALVVTDPRTMGLDAVGMIMDLRPRSSMVPSHPISRAAYSSPLTAILRLMRLFGITEQTALR